jgi:excisionase family DNA binding protein
MGKPMTTKEAAEQLKLSERTVRLYIKEGRIKATPFGRSWSIDADEVEKFAKVPRIAGWYGQKRNRRGQGMKK